MLEALAAKVLVWYDISTPPLGQIMAILLDMF